MTTPAPNPAVVAQREVQRLPRWALVLLCLAYLLPGWIGRSPWRNADLMTFGFALSVAEGRSPWLQPTLGHAIEAPSRLATWLGALAINALGFLPPAWAVRLPFVLTLTLTLAAVWYATYYLARTNNAQPVPMAFGGEADPVDYARALADGGLLAIIATLGLLQFGHETTPELMQVGLMAWMMWALAVTPWHPRRARASVLVALPALALAGSPTVAIAAASVGVLICQRSSFERARALVPWLVCAALVAASLATALDLWRWHASGFGRTRELSAAAKQLMWFTWPTLPLALWALWCWRRQLVHRHLAVPLGLTLVALVAWIVTGGTERALTLALPGLAVLAAFSLPTLARSTAAAIDWFTLFVFSAMAMAGWIMASSMLFGLPAKPLANMRRLAPGFEPHITAVALVLASVATLAWVALVRWRTARHQHALWKSMVLPAGGVTLAWLLAMTLLIGALDYARGMQPWVAQLLRQVPAGSCIWASGLTAAQVAALEVHGDYPVWLRSSAQARPRAGCHVWLINGPIHARAPSVPAGWVAARALRRPTDRREQTWVFLRQPPAAASAPAP